MFQWIKKLFDFQGRRQARAAAFNTRIATAVRHAIALEKWRASPYARQLREVVEMAQPVGEIIPGKSNWEEPATEAHFRPETYEERRRAAGYADPNEPALSSAQVRAKYGMPRTYQGASVNLQNLPRVPTRTTPEKRRVDDYPTRNIYASEGGSSDLVTTVAEVAILESLFGSGSSSADSSSSGFDSSSSSDFSGGGGDFGGGGSSGDF